MALRQLSNPDRHIRYAARLVLEHQKPELYKKEVLSSANSDVKIQGTLALVRSGETDGNALLKNLLSLSLINIL